VYAALERCAVFVAIGTSGLVYPAAGFVEAARAAGAARTIEINLEPSATASAFAERRTGRAGDLVPALVAELLA
jgi:NAD-dependent deacetylase